MQYMREQPLTPEEREERERQREQREADLRLKNNRLAITIFQISWIMVFVCLIVAYWQLGFSPGWRPAPGNEPDFVLPTIATIGLLASTWLARTALRKVEANRVKAFLAQWRSAIILGALFLAIMISQFFAVSPETTNELYVYIYRAMVGYHALHALAIGFLMVQVYRYGKAGAYHAENTWAVEGTTRLWYFVTIAWVLFYVTLYLI